MQAFYLELPISIFGEYSKLLMHKTVTTSDKQ